jgi:excisionase family DNA binding protein
MGYEKTINNHEMAKAPDLVLTVAEVAAFLKVSESIVRRLIREGGIPYFKVARRYLIYLPGLEEWIQSRIIRPVDATDTRAQEIAQEILQERS